MGYELEYLILSSSLLIFRCFHYQLVVCCLVKGNWNIFFYFYFQGGAVPLLLSSLFHNSFLLKFIIFFGREKGRFMAGISQLVFFIIQMPKKKREEKSVNKVATTIPKKRAYCIQLSERTVGQQQREYREKCRSAFRAVLGGKRGVLHIKIWDYGKPVSYGLCIR